MNRPALLQRCFAEHYGASTLLIVAFVLAGCGSARETVEVTQRPRPAFEDTASVTAPISPPSVTAQLDTVEIGPFPGGKMWLVDDLPVSYLRERYGLEADSTWRGNVQSATLRLPNCSASFVSGDGLVVTNYHCIREHLPPLGRDDEDILERGFVADSLEDARRPPKLFADRLLTTTDVTRRVRSRIDHVVDDDRRADITRSTIERLENQLTTEAKQRDTTYHVQIISLYGGAEYVAYRYERIHDLRLVMVPDQHAGRFGGDTDNYSFPRYTMDVAFLRAYDVDGAPIRPPAYFRWSPGGVQEGDPVFTAGHPASTSRLQTHAQLEHVRDYELPAEMSVINARAAALVQFLNLHPLVADSVDARHSLMALRNVQKEQRGRIEALRDANFMRRIRARDAQVEARASANDSLLAALRAATRGIEAVQRTKRAAAAQARPFVLFGAEIIDSHVLIRAVYAFLHDFARQRGAPAEYVNQYRNSGGAIETWPPELEELFLAARLRELEEGLGHADPSVSAILRGRTADEAAAAIVRGTALVDSAGYDSLVQAGFLSSGDPAVRLAESIVPLYLSVSEQQGNVQAREQRHLASLGEVRRRVEDQLAPDGTFSLRVSDGTVSGYPYNGMLAPPYTTFYGMYNAHYGREGDDEWELPEWWLEPAPDFRPETPLNFVATIDLTGGSSGSPVFTSDLSLVGVAFDSNYPALGSSYLYTPGAGRGIIVDARGIIHALEHVYGADELVEELRNGSRTASAE